MLGLLEIGNALSAMNLIGNALGRSVHVLLLVSMLALVILTSGRWTQSDMHLLSTVAVGLSLTWVSYFLPWYWPWMVQLFAIGLIGLTAWTVIVFIKLLREPELDKNHFVRPTRLAFLVALATTMLAAAVTKLWVLYFSEYAKLPSGLLGWVDAGTFVLYQLLWALSSLALIAAGALYVLQLIRRYGGNSGTIGFIGC